MTDPAIRARIMAQVKASGMSQEQIRTQLKGQGYSDDVINQLLGGAGVDTTAALSEDVFAAVRSLGLMDSTVVDSLRNPFLLRQRLRVRADSALLDTIGLALKNDTLRAAIQLHPVPTSSSLVGSSTRGMFWASRFSIMSLSEVNTRRSGTSD